MSTTRSSRSTGYAKQGSGYGYSGIRGLNALLATVTTAAAAPIIVAQRLRKGACGSPRGAARLVADALKTGKTGHRGSRALVAGRLGVLRPPHRVRRHQGRRGRVGDGPPRQAGQDGDQQIPDDAWPTIAYTDAIFDQATRQWISRAEVAEIPFTAFTSNKQADQIPGRLVVRRIPDLNHREGQDTLFQTWRFHAFFTTSTLDTAAADKTHRGHAIIEQVHADLKVSALAHLPSGKFCANAAWLVCAVIAFNLTRAAATLTGPTLATATTATIRRKLIIVPARIAYSARRITLHLPQYWPWESGWTTLFSRICGPPAPAPS